MQKTEKTVRTEKKTYYITTPIYYPSGKWHIGHCYTTVACDVLSRFKRMQGFDVFYLTGTDEHGQKVEKSALKVGVSPKKYVDGLVDEIKELWRVLDIKYDKYIRTTDDYHEKAVQKIFTTLYEKGDIYKSKYSGKYCSPCEAFFTASQLKDGKCPDCGREVTDAEEECYFFRLSKYADRVRKYLSETDFLQPKSRVNEMINFIDLGLEDVAVSRTSFSWGVPVPFDTKHVIYVWIDALSNYITALGYGSEDDSLFKKYWPANLHLMAKEIVRFHAIIWPAILLALDIPLPKAEFGHGWIMFDGDKMSKSKGNVVDPFILTARYGVDSLRYYLMRDINFGTDGNYTPEIFLTRLNSDLANDLGNLTKRTLAMAKQYFNGSVKKGKYESATDKEFADRIDALRKSVDEKMDKLQLNKALEVIFELIGNANKYIDVSKPWVLNKEQKTDELSTVIYNLTEAIRVSTIMLTPFLVNAPSKIFDALGLKLPNSFDDAFYGAVKAYECKEIETLFKRYDIKKEIDELDEILKEKSKEGERALCKTNEKVTENAVNAQDKQITIDEFFNTKLVVALVKEAERVEKSEKLLKLTLDVGGEKRTVVSGIAKSYKTEDLIGRKVILVANLKPARLCGIESQGMILCASDSEGKPVLLTPLSEVESGSVVS